MTSQALSAASYTEDDSKARIESSPQFKNGKFANEAEMKEVGFFKAIYGYFTAEQKDKAPTKPIPLNSLTAEGLLTLEASEPSLYRLGHSTMLMWLDGNFWLTDPVFSKRASPFTFAGPKRFHEPPLTVEELPQIKGVILSHNHYDHLDKNTIKVLHTKVDNFFVPLGIGADLLKWGVPAEKIIELDWWQNTTVAGVKLTATPSQHFSGRSLSDGNKTLWASWAIEASEHKIFFSGDSGYFKGFKEIGDRLGPFDITLMETGAYNELWPSVHMMPSESLQAHLDVKGKHLLPIHNGTFDLSIHSWYEPFEEILALSEENQVALLTPEMGQEIRLKEPVADQRWWRGLN